MDRISTTATRRIPVSPIKDPVMVFYKFKNEEKAGLGIPLPAGNLRVYQKDSKGGLLFIGEDHIDHTPKDELITVKIGNAFDVVAERKQTDYKKIARSRLGNGIRITLRNHKDTPITVQVNEPIGGDWEMLSSTYKAHKDGGVCRAVQCSGQAQRRICAEVSRSRALVTTDQILIPRPFDVGGRRA